MAVDDRTITRAVEQAFAWDDRVPADAITVHTEAGIVTLTGEVDHALARDFARRKAETIKGVRAVVNRITVRGVPRADGELLKDVQMMLHLDPATAALPIRASVHDGTVTLAGTVSSRLDKDIAADLVRGVAGVRAIENGLEVAPLRSSAAASVVEGGGAGRVGQLDRDGGLGGRKGAGGVPRVGGRR
jgi:osmotically-inducible protein OsmY